MRKIASNQWLGPRGVVAFYFQRVQSYCIPLFKLRQHVQLEEKPTDDRRKIGLLPGGHFQTPVAKAAMPARAERRALDGFGKRLRLHQFQKY